MVDEERTETEDNSKACMPPLPAKKISVSYEARSQPAPSRPPGPSPQKDGDNALKNDPNLFCKPTHDGDSRAVTEAMLDPSCWVLKNLRTGQEVEAAAFVQSLLNRPVPQWSISSPPFGSSGAMSWPKRNRNKMVYMQRPTLLPPQGKNDCVSFTAASVGPPSSPPLQLSLSTVPSRSPKRESRTSLKGGALSPTRGISNSDSTNSTHLSTAFNLRNMSTAQIVPKLHCGGIRAMCFSPSGNFLATCGVDRRCCVFRVQQGRQTAGEGCSPKAGVGEEGLSRPRSPASVVGRLIDDRPMRILTGHTDSVVDLTWVGDDSALLSASADGTVRCWHPLDGDECSTIYEHGDGVTSVAWEPPSSQRGDGLPRRFITGSLDARIRMFSLDSSEPQQSVLVAMPVTAVAFCPGGQAFAVGYVSGMVEFFRTENMTPQLTVECRRHGFRHSAAQRTRLATSPVRRLSTAGKGNANDKDNANRNAYANGNASSNANANGGSDGTGSTTGNGNGTERGGRRRSTMGTRGGARFRGPVEERVTGLSFRPQAAKTLAQVGGECGASDGEGHGILTSPRKCFGEEMGNSPQKRAPTSGVLGEIENDDGREVDRQGKARACNALMGPLNDLLVSTNDNRSRILVSGEGGEVTVAFKLKGHNTEGALRRHTCIARYSEDGQFIISGSTNGNVHVFTTPSASGSSKEGQQLAQVCDKTVAVPVALFAPASVVRRLGGSSHVILTGDDEGCCKVFWEG